MNQWFFCVSIHLGSHTHTLKLSLGNIKASVGLNCLDYKLLRFINRLASASLDFAGAPVCCSNNLTTTIWLPWFYCSWQLSSTQSFFTPFSGMRKRVGRIKVRTLVGWDTVSLIDKSQTKQRLHSPLPVGRQVFRHPQESMAPSHVMVVCEYKCCNSERVFLLLSQYCMLSMASYVMEYPCGQLGSAIPNVPSPFLVHPQPPCWWGGGRGKEVLDCMNVAQQ